MAAALHGGGSSPMAAALHGGGSFADSPPHSSTLEHRAPPKLICLSNNIALSELERITEISSWTRFTRRLGRRSQD